MALKEITDWEVFVKDLSIEIIEESREHAGKPMDAIKDICLGLVGEKLRGEAIEAIKGSMSIPAEVKAAAGEDWFEFVTNTVMAVPEFIEAFTKDVVNTPVNPA